MKNVNEISLEIESKIQAVINGAASQYITFYSPYNEDDLWTVRISNHAANPNRMNDRTISLIVDLPEVAEDSSFGFSVNKKTFPFANNQFIIDEFGSFKENFETINECIDYVIY